MGNAGPDSWDREVDVVVVGYGAAGGVAAIEAHDSGAETLILEKMAFPGGLSIASAGGIRVTDDADRAFDYLSATCGGRTPAEILRVLADGMRRLPDYLRRLAAVNGASVRVTPALGNYPLPGFESLAYCEVDAVPELEGCSRHHAMQPIKNGTRLFKLLEDNVRARRIPIAYDARGRRLVTGADGAVLGLVAEIDSEPRRIRARRGVVLTCGGFEADPEMQRQYFQATPVLTGSFRGNTGDGIRMAQAAGADLWHMWHYHGPYGLKHPDPDYPFALYLKAIPMWTPGRPDYVSDLGVGNGGGDRASAKALARMVWILVDQRGRRFMDEYPPYPGDTGVRPFDAFDPKTQSFPNNPAFMLFDETGRTSYPLGRSVHNDLHPRYDWSPDNSREIELGIFERADDLPALAASMGVPADTLIDTVERWNRAVDSGVDADFGRQPDTMQAIRTPPYYFGRVHPVVINTQGGPRRDACQRVLTPFGEPIPRLYAAGELGSVFGHLYMSGGNLAECFIGGWIAARHAASLPDWQT
jgi:succinate dehydrogenase/fumarate reductase flavoprotein subunit